MGKRVWLAAPVSAVLLDWFKEQGYELWETIDKPDAPESIEGIITSNRLQLQESLIKEFPNLHWIGRMGSGMEIIDTAYCARVGIACFSSPGGLANSVAEHATGMLLSVLHRIHSSAKEVEQGLWIREPNRGNELAQLCVGLIGYGHTGKAFARKLAAFTENIIAYDKYHPAQAGDIARAVSLEELQAQADILSFHVPLNAETRHYYDADFLAKMQKSHILMNTSRGPVCPSDIVLNGLQSGKIRAACLDVLEEEKQIESVLREPDNIVQQLLRYPVLITPHIAGYSHQATHNMSLSLRNQLNAFMNQA